MMIIYLPALQIPISTTQYKTLHTNNTKSINTFNNKSYYCLVHYSRAAASKYTKYRMMKTFYRILCIYSVV